jgi:hypothetical protein
MTKDEIIEMLRASCDKDRVDPEQNGFWVIVTEELEAFAKLIAEKSIKEALAQEQEPVAIRYDFDGYGYQYIDSGSGSDWQTRVRGEPLYTTPKIAVGCAECGVGNNHALYCVTCAENYLKDKNT